MASRNPSGALWTPAEYEELADLLHRIGFDLPDSDSIGTPISDGVGGPVSRMLKGLMFPKPVDTSSDWKCLEKNSLYIRLMDDAGFVSMDKAFRKLKTRKGVKWSQRSEFRFIFFALLAAQQYYLDRRSRAASGQGLRLYSGERKAGREAIETLKAILQKRIRWSEPLDGYRLGVLLDKLDSVLANDKKMRETDRTPATDAIRLLARYLTVDVGVPVRSVLEDFAAWLGTDTNSTTIATISAEAKRRWEDDCSP